MNHKEIDEAINEIYEDPDIQAEIHYQEENATPQYWANIIVVRTEAIKDIQEEIKELLADMPFWEERRVNNMSTKQIRNKAFELIDQTKDRVRSLGEDIKHEEKDIAKAREKIKIHLDNINNLC